MFHIIWTLNFSVSRTIRQYRLYCIAHESLQQFFRDLSGPVILTFQQVSLLMHLRCFFNEFLSAMLYVRCLMGYIIWLIWHGQYKMSLAECNPTIVFKVWVHLSFEFVECWIAWRFVFCFVRAKSGYKSIGLSVESGDFP